MINKNELWEDFMRILVTDLWHIKEHPHSDVHNPGKAAEAYRLDPIFNATVRRVCSRLMDRVQANEVEPNGEF